MCALVRERDGYRERKKGKRRRLPALLLLPQPTHPNKQTNKGAKAPTHTQPPPYKQAGHARAGLSLLETLLSSPSASIPMPPHAYHSTRLRLLLAVGDRAGAMAEVREGGRREKVREGGI